MPNPSRLRALGPWLVAAICLVLLFRSVGLGSLRDALSRANLVLFCVLVVSYQSGLLLADAFATWITLARALPDVPLGYREIFQIRAATYALAQINYGVGQGGIAYFLHRRHRIPIAAAAGAVILTAGVNFLLLVACASAGMLLGGAPAEPMLRTVAIVAGLGLPCWFGVLALRPRFLAERGLLRPLFTAGVSGHLIVAAARLPHFCVLVAGHFLAMRLFGVAVPLPTALALLPVLFLVAVLPIAPSGLGTAQAAAVVLFSPFGPGAGATERNAAVLAYSLSLHAATVLINIAIGLVFLRRLTREAQP